MTANLVNRRVVLSSRPKGVPLTEHFTVDEVAVPELGEGEFLVKTDYWSVDPAMRGWANDAPNYLPPVEIGAAMRSFAVGKLLPAAVRIMRRAIICWTCLAGSVSPSAMAAMWTAKLKKQTCQHHCRSGFWA